MPEKQIPEKTLLVFGDSLTAGLGVKPGQDFPAQLEAALAEKGMKVHVINAGVSGDTSGDGLARLAWTLNRAAPQYVILALGANDMLRHLDPKLTASNLDKMGAMLANRHIPVLVAGMRAFTNMGYIFGDAYLKMYKDLARKYGAVYYPFFLEGVALKPEYTQQDGTHPNAKGVAVVVKNIMPAVEKLLARDPAPARPDKNTGDKNKKDPEGKDTP